VTRFSLAVLTATLIAPVSANAQTGNATSNGLCSIANSGNTVENLTINCGIGKEQGQKIIDMLNSLLASRDTATINAKLDELLAVAQRIPPKILGLEMSDDDGGGTKNPLVRMTFTVDRVFQNPAFLVFCDKPCQAGAGAEGLLSISPQSLGNPNYPLVSGATLGIPILYPKTKVTVEAHSLNQEKIRVLRVEPYLPPLHP
jgi:hypothetical protein